MANNEQTNLAVISNTNQTPNEPYIVPFDSENGMLIEVWICINSCLNISNFGELCSILIEFFLKPNVITLSDFSQLQLKDNLEQYFHQKLNYGRQLGLSPQLILKGLTDGMPTSIKQLMTVNPPTSPTEWLMVATRLMKTQAPKPEQNYFRQNVPIRPRQNTFVPQNRYSVRPNFQSFNRMRPHNISQISMLITLTIDVLGRTTTHIFNMDCHHLHVVLAHNKEFPMLIIGNYNVLLININ
ncbi:uncharacterized protein TNCV_4691381 [Trichonephila clavipes]|nr:uncharacterized protein TNCV_4691381 [Trichonephila clavipes]